MDPRTVLTKLARQSAAAWLSLGESAYAGDVSIETKNTMYLFHNGVFVSRARKPTRANESPSSMRGVRLIGFLLEERGGVALSTEWVYDSAAVLWRPDSIANGVDENAFRLTSPTLDIAITVPEPRVFDFGAHRLSSSNVFRRSVQRPPTHRRPAPPSMTRIMPFSPDELTGLTGLSST